MQFKKIKKQKLLRDINQKFFNSFRFSLLITKFKVCASEAKSLKGITN